MRQKNLPRFLSTDSSERSIVIYHTIFQKPSLKRGKMGFMNCAVLDVRGHVHPISAVQRALCEGQLESICISGYVFGYTYVH